MNRLNMSYSGIILAAGRGQRITYIDTPKPLLLLYGQTLIERQIERLQEAGTSKIYIVAGSFRAQLSALLSTSSAMSVPLTFIDQPNDQAGIPFSLASAFAAVAEDCFVTSCDLLFEKNPFQPLPRQADIEMAIDTHIKQNKFCAAGIKIRTKLLGLHELGEHLPKFNGYGTGCYWFTRKGQEAFQKAAASLSSDAGLATALSALTKEMPIRFIRIPAMTWFDINTPDTLLRAEMFCRAQAESSRPTKVRLARLKPLVSPLSFFYQKSTETRIIIEPGLLKRLADYKLMEPERTASRHIIITDETVDKLFGEPVAAGLSAAGYDITKLAAPAGERAKSMAVYNQLAEEIVALGIDEQSVIFALGGGVVANLAGFLAATLYRGIGLIHLPTTLMNMLDVSVSLKQGINSQKGKNLVGSYYQPLAALIDPALPMPIRLVSEGLSEAIKHAICQDSKFFDWLRQFSGNREAIDFRQAAIERTIQLKIKLMREDMFEHRQAMILQYGHEVGHALEFLSVFTLSHGQAIAIGMCVSAELARLMGVADEETVSAHREIFNKYGLPIAIPPHIAPEAIIDSLRYNKKTRGSDIRLVLPERIGKAWKIKGEFGIPCPIKFIHQAIIHSYDAEV